MKRVSYCFFSLIFMFSLEVQGGRFSLLAMEAIPSVVRTARACSGQHTKQIRLNGSKRFFASDSHPFQSGKEYFSPKNAGYRIEKEGQLSSVIVASIATEDIIVKSSVPYLPQYVTDVFGKTDRVTKDVTFVRLLNDLRKNYQTYELVSMGTPVNFNIAPTHLTRVEMEFQKENQLQACLKAISVSDMLIRSRVQPAWEWVCVARSNLGVLLHVGWYDTVYFMQFKDIFLGDMHCRYSAKFSFDPHDAVLTHFRYTDCGELEAIKEYSEAERYADSIKDKVEFLRVFRDKTVERT